MEGTKTMFELNEQELEQIAGGHGHHYGSKSTAGGDASAFIGAAESSSSASSIVTHRFAASHAENDSVAVGIGVGVDSGASTAAGR